MVHMNEELDLTPATNDIIIPAVGDSYVSQASWLDNSGRDDLIDSIADDFERHRARVVARHRAA